MAHLCNACGGAVCEICGGCINHGECSCETPELIKLRAENERLCTAMREIIRLPPFGSSSIAKTMQDIAKAALDAAGE